MKIRALCLVVLLAVVGCSNGPTAPAEPTYPSPVGEFALLTKDGETLPLFLGENLGGDRLELSEGRLEVKADHSFEEWATYRFSLANGQVFEQSNQYKGTWSQTRDRLTLMYEPDPSGSSLPRSGAAVLKSSSVIEMTLTEGSSITTWVYQK